MSRRQVARSLLLTVGLLTGIVGCATSSTTKSETPGQWPAQRTWLMMVGVLDQMNTDVHGSFDKKDRKDRLLFDTFIERGVPAEQAVFVKDSDATLANIESQLAALLAKTKKGDFLMLFFDGHGTVNEDGEGYFVPYDAPGRGDEGLWKMSDAFNQIEEQFNGDNVLVMADCCHAGAMSHELKNLETTRGYACLASSAHDVTSPDLWTFTESLIDGFAGRSFVDSNSDGRISLSELRETCWWDMVWFYTHETVFSRNVNFPAALVLVKAGRRGHEDVGKYFEIRPGGKGRWHRAKAIDHENGSLKLGYYPDEWLTYAMIKIGSENIRPIVRRCYSRGDEVDVRWLGIWSPARVVEVDREKGLHKVRYGGKNPEPDGWYACNHLRLRPDSKKQP